MLEIRLARSDDAAGVRACLVELQDHERALEPLLAEGAAMADAHLAQQAEQIGTARHRQPKS